MKYIKIHCDKCNREIRSSNFKIHFKSCNGIIKQKHLSIDENWKQDNGKYKCPFCNNEFKKLGISYHIWRKHYDEGKNKKIIRKTPPWNKGLRKETDNRVNNYSKKISKSLTGKKKRSLTAEEKRNLSIKLKLAHKEGRAWNIGMSRWNNKPSYPEKFFMKVIENEFEDKNY